MEINRKLIKSVSSTIFKLTSTQSINNESFTTVLYTQKTVVKGIDLVEISDGNLQIKEKGLYLILLNTVFNTNATGVRYQDIRYKNNSYALASSLALPGLRSALSSFVLLNLEKNDTFFSRAYQTSGNNLNLIGDSTVTISRLL